MSAPSESAATPAPCACTNISLMQLFHELKQKFPGVPDHVVSNTIELYCHDKQACETHLHSEVKASLTHAYHASSLAAARHLNKLKINLPGKCKNQPIVKHDAVKLTPLKSISCQGPQAAVLSSNLSSDEDKENKLHTDNNQNIVNVKKENITNNITSPVTEINIDNCYAKYYAESSSDLELTNENLKVSTNEDEFLCDSAKELEQVQLDLSESTNYKILKSSKVKYNLHEKLEKANVKKTIKKPDIEHHTQESVQPEKPKRPNTLDFIKPNPDLAFKQSSTEAKQPSPTHSPSQKVSSSQGKETKPSQSTKQEKFPLNFSVNVNCHMDLSRGYSDPWLEDYDSPRAITSVNLTVCTPTSNMASPVRDVHEGDDGGFEGHVTVTVSPSTARPPRRRAPAPPPQPSRLESPRPVRSAPEPPGLRSDLSLIERQKERLSRLATALSQEQGRLAQLNKERKILSAPPPSPASAQMIKEDVERLRDMCDSLAKRLESIGSEPVDSDSFYSNIYTGQQPPSSWQCHLCTFRNHPLLDTCEGCDMRRIFVGTSPSSTHDSGFGSFRDRTRRGAINSNVSLPHPPSNPLEDRNALPIN